MIHARTMVGDQGRANFDNDAAGGLHGDVSDGDSVRAGMNRPADRGSVEGTAYAATGDWLDASVLRVCST